MERARPLVWKTKLQLHSDLGAHDPGTPQHAIPDTQGHNTNPEVLEKASTLLYMSAGC